VAGSHPSWNSTLVDPPRDPFAHQLARWLTGAVRHCNSEKDNMNRRPLAVIAALAFVATACGGHNSRADQETTSARVERHDDRVDHDRDEVRDVQRVDHDDGVRDDGDHMAVTAADQGNGEADLSITRQIRQAVVADDRLSLSAKNITIVTREGVVTLRGEVDTTAEHAVLQEITNRVPGVRRLDDQVVVDAD
jgi:hypothetical protein